MFREKCHGQGKQKYGSKENKNMLSDCAVE
jgi:hypothetical protein